MAAVGSKSAGAEVSSGAVRRNRKPAERPPVLETHASCAGDPTPREEEEEVAAAQVPPTEVGEEKRRESSGAAACEEWLDRLSNEKLGQLALEKVRREDHSSKDRPAPLEEEDVEEKGGEAEREHEEVKKEVGVAAEAEEGEEEEVVVEEEEVEEGEEEEEVEEGEEEEEVEEVEGAVEEEEEHEEEAAVQVEEIEEEVPEAEEAEKEKEVERAHEPEFNSMDFEEGGCEAVSAPAKSLTAEMEQEPAGAAEEVPPTQPPSPTLNPPTPTPNLHWVLLDAMEEVKTLVSDLEKKQLTPLNLEMLWKDEVQRSMLEIQQLAVEETTARINDVQQSLHVRLYHFRDSVEKLTSSAHRELSMKIDSVSESLTAAVDQLGGSLQRGLQEFVEQQLDDQTARLTKT